MTNKTILIVGGSSDIGKAIIQELAASGYNILATYNKTKIDESVKNECQKHNCQYKEYKLDLLKSKEINKFFSKISDEQSLVGMVYCAGVSKPERLLIDEELDNIDEILDVNLKAAIICTQLFIRHMGLGKSGNIVYISSIYGQYGGSCESVYSATKGGLNALAKSLAVEYGNSGMRINCVCPGCIETRMTSGFAEEEKQAIKSSVPLNRLGRAEDVAGAVSFLLSDKASYITGETLTISGGALRF